MFKIVACVNKKMALGSKGELLYHIKDDLKNFSSMTSFNGVVVMGRKTYESIKKPLKNRINIILTSDKDYSIEPNDNVYILHSIDDAVELCNTLFEDKELFLIGGGSLYKEFLERGLVDEIRLSIVDDDKNGDVYFPEINLDDWYTYFALKGVDYEYKILKKPHE